MAVHAAISHPYSRLESLPTNRSLFTAAVVMASLVLLNSGIQNLSIAPAQAQSLASTATSPIAHETQFPVDESGVQSAWSPVDAGSEGALVLANGIEAPVERAAAGRETLAQVGAFTRQGEATVLDPSASAQEFAAVAPQQEPALAPAPAAVALRPLEASMLAAVNARRAAVGLRPVAIDPLLTEVSRQRSNHMAGRNYFSHTTPEGTTYIDELSAVGIATGTVGEILGRTNASEDVSVAMVVEAFAQSPSHDVHLVYGTYEWAGVGVAIGPDFMKYYTIIFRTPA